MREQVQGQRSPPKAYRSPAAAGGSILPLPTTPSGHRGDDQLCGAWGGSPDWVNGAPKATHTGPPTRSITVTPGSKVGARAASAVAGAKKKPTNKPRGYGGQAPASSRRAREGQSATMSQSPRQRALAILQGLNSAPTVADFGCSSLSTNRMNPVLVDRFWNVPFANTLEKHREMLLSDNVIPPHVHPVYVNEAREGTKNTFFSPHTIVGPMIAVCDSTPAGK